MEDEVGLTSARPRADLGARQNRNDRWCEPAYVLASDSCSAQRNPRPPHDCQSVVAMAPVNWLAAAHRVATPTLEEARALVVAEAGEMLVDEERHAPAPTAAMMDRGERQRAVQLRGEQVCRPKQ